MSMARIHEMGTYGSDKLRTYIKHVLPPRAPQRPKVSHTCISCARRASSFPFMRPSPPTNGAATLFSVLEHVLLHLPLP
jgi:hypothetical protein